MTDVEDVLADRGVDFDSAFAYALSPAMIRLIIVFLTGWLLLPVGLLVFFTPELVVGYSGIVREAVGMVIGLAVIVGAGGLLVGGLIGALFKTIADANRYAASSE
ncbi:hypothetical protein [Halopenitus sp. POP-27]|uniref:hypothetical protein n=1 Tax=Halopenitus sp. POP-27 TaxID=2994425 RepID=UPI002469458E|nr:hypothetical protein [Halopenitus sp. POP-27]